MKPVATGRTVRGTILAVVLATSAMALLVEASAMLANELRVYRNSVVADLATEASILALSTAPALAFDDQRRASQNLSALQARPSLQAAALYDDRGLLYASFVRPGAEAPATRLSLSVPALRIRSQSIEVSRSVALAGENLGTIYLRDDYDIRSRVSAYLGICALAALLSLVAALVLSRILQKGITEPLEAMADVARVTARLESTMTAAETGSWVWDLRTNSVSVDVSLATILGISDELLLFADSLRRSQSLSNLLTNAAKYTDPGGRITVRAALTSDAIVLSVSDTGIGFDEALTPRMFEMFTQINAAIDRTEGGLGIGPALVRGLIGLHGGTVSATSAGPGHGSEFAIHLPLSVMVNRVAATAPDISAPRVTGPQRCKVLVVDDNRDAADGLAILLRMSDFDVHVAYSGADALTVASLEQPDAAILDIGMPGVTGYEVARRIRQQEWGRSALLLAVTGWGQQSDIEKTRAAGFDHHLTKPVAPGMIEDQLDRFLRSRGCTHSG